MGLSSLSRWVWGMFSSQRRVWVLLPVPLSPRHMTAAPSQTTTDECTGTAPSGRAAMAKAVQSAKRKAAGWVMGVSSTRPGTRAS